jgi:hypothetical protein
MAGGVSKEGGTCALRERGNIGIRTTKQMEAIFLNLIDFLLLSSRGILVLIIDGDNFQDSIFFDQDPEDLTFPDLLLSPFF